MLFGIGACGGLNVFGYAVQPRDIVNQIRPLVNRIKYVFGKFLGCLGLGVGDFCVVFTRGTFQFNTAQAKVTNSQLDDALANGGQLAEAFAVLQANVMLVQTFVQTNPGGKLGHLRQTAVIGFTQFGSVDNSVQVAGYRPGSPQACGHVFNGVDQGVPG